MAVSFRLKKGVPGAGMICLQMLYIEFTLNRVKNNNVFVEVCNMFIAFIKL